MGRASCGAGSLSTRRQRAAAAGLWNFGFQGPFRRARLPPKNLHFLGNGDSRQSTALEVAKLIEREAVDQVPAEGRKHGVGNKRLGDEVSRPHQVMCGAALVSTGETMRLPPSQRLNRSRYR